MAGGMMHFGIPAYRLPRAELDAEISRIEQLGVTIVLNHTVTDLDEERGHLATAADARSFNYSVCLQQFFAFLPGTSDRVYTPVEMQQKTSTSANDSITDSAMQPQFASCAGRVAPRQQSTIRQLVWLHALGLYLHVHSSR
jgi:hypothetical protein